MSSPPTLGSGPPQQGGLGRSTPLVTVSNVHSGIRTSTSERMAPTATPAGSDHPLASPPPSVELSERAAPEPNTAASPPPPKTPVSPPTVPTVAALPPPAVVSPTKKPPPSSLDAMADHFLSGPSPRTEAGLPPALKPIPLPKDERGMQRLRTLVLRRAWGDVLQVCGDMLRGPASPYHALYTSLVDSQNSVPSDDSSLDALKQDTVEILTLECHGWLKLRRYAELGREVDQWNFLSYNDSNATSPSWIPWSLHILAAETLQYTDPTSNRCVDELFAIRSTLVEEKQTAWLTCVDNALSNVFIRRKEWRLALAALDNMQESLRGATEYLVQTLFKPEDDIKENEREWAIDKLSGAFRCEVLSRQGRIMLELGALLEASTLFESANVQWSKSTADSADISRLVSDKVDSQWIMKHIPAQMRINGGLLCFSHSDYDQAMSLFRKAIDILRALHTASTPLYNVEDWMGPTVARFDTHSTALSNCWNNMSLCALYTCRMQDAVRMMESLIREDPTFFLTERLAFNLCTLYELGSDGAASTRKKRVLQVIAKRFYLHDIGPESFRVN